MLNPITIKIVEDDQRHAGDVVRMLLSEFPEAHVEVIRTESQFRSELHSLQNNPPDLIILDMMLRWSDPTIPPGAATSPEGGFEKAGLRCFQLLQSDVRTKSLPVIFVTALSERALVSSIGAYPPVIEKRSMNRSQLGTLVRSLLAVRQESQSADPETTRLRSGIFISYSHQDSRWLRELEVTLRPHVRAGDLQYFSDRDLKPGELWQELIMRELNQARIAVLLVSRYFMSSDFIARFELPAILDATTKDGLVVFWIAVSASAYKESLIANFTCANRPEKPLDRLSRAHASQELVLIAEKLAHAYRGTDA